MVSIESLFPDCQKTKPVSGFYRIVTGFSVDLRRRVNRSDVHTVRFTRAKKSVFVVIV